MSINPLIKELNKIIDLYRLPNMDTSDSIYDSEEAAVNDMRDIISALQHGDFGVLDRLIFLFAPKGPVQEISLGNGWPDTYIGIANRVDRCIGKIRREQKFKNINPGV